MATISYVASDIPADKSRCHVISWDPVTEADTCQPLQMPASADRSVQVVGTFGGGTITFEGSNDGVNYSVLTDPQGNELNITSTKIETITEITRYMRPRVTSGTGVSIGVHLLIRRVR